MSSLWSITRKGISNQGIESDSDAEPDTILDQVSPYELFADELISKVSKIETLSDENEIVRLSNQKQLGGIIKELLKIYTIRLLIQMNY
ncbi:hypothetical protein M0812_12510 [Anaeramoeba flamelloides]|uniref:Uncharacterized protein n=1 Tax=Anaeramoeba flamelloides TaxID=1746091 RepID=A0AAV7ZS21_9EUKA|nr:hypothetical protein M0812_12510 [Anaeramoeba flamelloides]